MRRGLWLGAFVVRQNVARSFDNLVRESGKLGDFDAVAAVGGSGLDFAQKNDSSTCLFHRHVIVLHAGKPLGELRQFEIMGSEQRLGPGACVQVLNGGPGDS